MRRRTDFWSETMSKLGLQRSQKRRVKRRPRRAGHMEKLEDRNLLATVSVSDALVTEGGLAIFEVNLSMSSGEAVTVYYGTVDGTAQAGSDYTYTNGYEVFNYYGETSSAHFITVQTTDDSSFEGNETFGLSLSVNGGMLVGGNAIGTIQDNDSSSSSFSPVISVNDATVSEGASATFTISLSSQSSQNVTVSYTTQNGTATTANNDYTAKSGAVVFSPNQTQANVVVATTNDSAIEPDETFSLVLSNPVGGTLGDSIGVGTITNNDFPSVTVSDAGNVTESSSATATFQISLTPQTSAGVTVYYRTVHGTTNNSDYTTVAPTSVVLGGGGPTTHNVHVPVTDDSVYENDETFYLSITSVTGANIADSQGMATIKSDDPPPPQIYAIDAANVAEDGSGTFAISLANATATSVTVYYTTQTGSASANDFTSVSSSVVLSSAQPSRPVVVAITPDINDEPDETFYLSITSVSNGTSVADATATATIIDDDPTPSVSISSAGAITEGTSAGFTIHLLPSVPSVAESITVYYQTYLGNASSDDITPLSNQSVVLGGNVTTHAILVATTPDSVDEPSETFGVRITNVTGTTVITESDGTATIIDDDPTPGVLVENAAAKVEGEPVSFTIRLNGSTTQQITVSYETVTGSADSNDFTATVSQVVLGGSTASATIVVGTKDDYDDEPEESFYLSVTGATGDAPIVNDLGEAHILDNDEPPSLSFTNTAVSVTEGQAAHFVIHLTPAISPVVTVYYETYAGTAGTNDFTPISNGSTQLGNGVYDRTITVNTTGDSMFESNETFSVRILSVTHDVSLTNSLAIGTIVNDDPIPAVTVSDAATVIEGASATFTIGLSHSTNESVTVFYHTRNGTTTHADFSANGQDSAVTQGSVVLGGTVNSQTVVIRTEDDMIDEGDETFSVTIVNHTGSATITDSVGIGTIQDNDAAPGVSLGPAIEVQEGDPAEFIIHLTSASGKSITVYYGTQSDTAYENSDYEGLQSVSMSVSVVIAPGETSMAISIPTIGDTEQESTESFTFELLGAEGASIVAGHSSTIAKILDNDNYASATVAVTASQPSIGEGDGSVDFTFTLTGDANASAAHTVYFSLGGEGLDAEDYLVQNSDTTFVVIPVGQTTAILSVDILDDGEKEATETLTLTLASNSGYNIADPSVPVTILDDDSTSTTATPCDCPCDCPPNDATGSPKTPDRPYNGQNIANRAEDNPHPIVVQNVTLQAAGSTQLIVELIFGGLVIPAVYYDVSSLKKGDTIRVAIQVDATTLGTGHHAWSMTVKERSPYVGEVTQEFDGEENLVSLKESEFGNRRWLDGLDRLVLYSSGAMLVEGGGNAWWFAKDTGGTYSRPLGEFQYSTLTAQGSDFVLTSKTGGTRTFDSTGLLKSRTDTFGRTTTYTYTDADGDSVQDEISVITDPVGNTTTFGYTSGRVTSITDHAGRITTYGYDTTGHMTTLTEPDPDGVGPLTSPVTTYTYDVVTGMLVAVLNPENEYTTYTYRADRTLASVTFADGTTEAYNAAWRKGMVIPGETSGSAAEPLAAVLAADVVATRTDTAEETRTLSLSNQGRVNSVTDALGNVTRYVRDKEGRVIAMITPDPDGAGPMSSLTTRYKYDALGNLVQQTNPNGTTESWTYDSTWNQVISYTDPLGKLTKYDLDSATGAVLVERRVVGALDTPQNLETDDVVTTFAYTSAPASSSDPPAGLLMVVWDALGGITTFDYNARGLLTKVTTAANTALETAVEYAYDSADNVISYTNELGVVTTYTYDALGRRIGMTLPDPDGSGGAQLAPTYSYVYDKIGRLVEEYDPLNRLTEYVYNALGQLTQVITPDHDSDGLRSVTSYVYDAAGRLEEVIDALGRSQTVTYDELGRITAELQPAPSGSGPRPTHQTTYGALGWVLSSTDPLNNVTNFVYENFGQKVTTKQVNPATGAQNTGPTSIQEFDAIGNLIQSTDERGYVTTYAYDDLYRLVSVTEPDPTNDGIHNPPVTTYSYDKLGRLTSVTDPLGNVTTYEYDALGRLVTVTQPDPDGVGGQSAPETTYTYDDAGQLLTVTDALSQVTSYAYDNLGRQTSVTLPDPDGAGSLTAPVTSYAYDVASRLVSVTDALGNVTSYGYDLHDNLVQVTQPDPDGAGGVSSPVTTAVYDDVGQLLSVTDPLGRITSYAYDQLGRVTSVTLPDPDGVSGSQTSPVYSYTYDLFGNLLTATDALNNVTTYSYDHLHRLIQVIAADPDGAGPQTSPVTSYTYDNAGHLLSVTDPLSRITSYTYDALGRRQTVTLPDPDGVGGQASPVLAYVYDLVGNLLTETDAKGQVTSYSYDDLYRLIEMEAADPDGVGGLTSPITAYAYDAVGQLLTVTDPLNRVTTYDYDDLGRRISVTLPDPDGVGGVGSPVTSYRYDAVGNLLETTDPLGKVTTLTYDNLYRLIQEQQPDPDGAGALGRPTTTYTYDQVGNRLTLTDPVNNTTTWTYDGLDRQITDTNELGKTRSFAYDAMGNLVQRTDRLGRVIEYEYDRLHRNVEERWLDGSSAVVRTLSYEYDAANQLVAAADPAASYTYTYDKLGRLTTETQDLEGLAPLLTFARAYDANGNRTSVAATIGATADYLTNYTFDNLNRVTRITQAGQYGGNTVAEKRFDMVYNAAGQRTSLARYADVGGSEFVATTSYDYDGLGRLTSLQHAQGVTALAGYDYTYDAASRITAIDSLLDGLTNYTHDHTGQLTDADHTGQTDEAYDYDENGNRSNYTIDDNNQIASDGTFNYEYDDEGNRTAKVHIGTGARTEYTWDHRNRLVNVTEKDSGGAVLSTVEQSYDLFNRWVRSEVDSNGPASGGESERIFAYDGLQIALEFEGGAGSDLAQRYVWDEAIDHLLAAEETGTLSASGMVVWPLTDHLGTTRDLAAYDTSADVTTVANHRRYDSFGNLVSETNSAVNILFGFTGRPYDEASDLQNNLNRWYDPVTGQWMSEDPIGFDALDGNLYRYVENSPLDSTDPNGLKRFRIPKPSSWAYSGLVDGIINSATVYQNMRNADNGVAKSIVVAGGFAAADACGVRGVSDAGSEHDALDAHVQSTGERWFDGISGATQLVLTAVGASQGIQALRPTQSGTATLMEHPGSPMHASIQVTDGTTTVHTHQVITAADMSSTQIVTAAQAPPGPVTGAVTVPLSNAQAALKRQAQLIKQGDLGPYDRITNSCLSHVADVVEAGGAKPPPPSPAGSAQWRWWRNLFKGKNE